MSKIAIVTGAGTGVGQIVAKKLSEDGMKVMLVGRRREKLEETKTSYKSDSVKKSNPVKDSQSLLSRIFQGRTDRYWH